MASVKSDRQFSGVFFGAFAVILLLGRSKLLQDPDTFWHIQVGRQMIDAFRLVYTDSFTFTFYGEPWIANQWLAETLMAVMDRIGGFDGLMVVAATILAAVFALIGGRLIGCGLHWLVAVLVLALIFAASAYNLQIRPHLATILFFTVLIAKLVDVDHRHAAVSSQWWLPILFLVWTNLHGGVLGGLFTLGLIVTAWTLQWLMRWPSPIENQLDFLWTCLIAAGCLLSTLVNPYGLEMHRAWLTILTSNLTELVIEHAPLDFGSPQGMAVLLLAALYVVVLIFALKGRFHVSWMIPIVWLLLSFTRIRHAPLFAVSAGVCLAALIPYSSLSPILERRGFFSTSMPSNGRPNRSWLIGCIPLGLFAICFVDCALVAAPHSGRRWATPHSTVWPQELLPSLVGIPTGASDSTPIFNEQEFGGFLIYNTPHLKVFIDGRCELFGEDFLRDYLQSRKDNTLIAQWESNYQFKHAMTKTGSPIDAYFKESANWQVLRQTPTSTLYARTEIP